MGKSISQHVAHLVAKRWSQSILFPIEEMFFCLGGLFLIKSIFIILHFTSIKRKMCLCQERVVLVAKKKKKEVNVARQDILASKAYRMAGFETKANLVC